MAIKPSSSTVPAMTPTQTPKKKGSGFVSFDKAAQQNIQASQQLGQQIGSNIGQQVQAAQGQVGAAAGGVTSQLGAEAARLGKDQEVVRGLQTEPTQVAKSQYQDLTSGVAKKADVKDLASLQGTLGSTAQVAQQLSSSPKARQQAIQSTVKRPTAMQNLAGIQRDLDAMLLGRNVNTQDLATQTARQAFNVDRLIGSTLKTAAEQGQVLQKQAEQARTQLKEARRAGIAGTEAAGETQAKGYNEAQQALYDYITKGKFFEELATPLKAPLTQEQEKITPEQTSPSQMEQALNLLKRGGLDLTKEDLDITDLGRADFENLIKSSVQQGLIDRTQALTNEQRARLKSLYGLEDEAYSQELEKEYAPAGTKFTGAEELRKRSEEAGKTTEQYKTAFDKIYQTLLTGAARNRGITDETKPGFSAALKEALIQGGKDPQYYDQIVDELFEQYGGGWGQARGQTMEDIQRFARRTPTRFSDIYKRNLKG